MFSSAGKYLDFWEVFGNICKEIYCWSQSYFPVEKQNTKDGRTETQVGQMAQDALGQQCLALLHLRIIFSETFIQSNIFIALQMFHSSFFF